MRVIENEDDNFESDNEGEDNIFEEEKRDFLNIEDEDTDEDEDEQKTFIFSEGQTFKENMIDAVNYYAIQNSAKAIQMLTNAILQGHTWYLKNTLKKYVIPDTFRQKDGTEYNGYGITQFIRVLSHLSDESNKFGAHFNIDPKEIFENMRNKRGHIKWTKKNAKWIKGEKK